MTIPSSSDNGTIDLSQRLALDVQSAAALKQAARADPRQGARAAARQFEAVFTQMMLKSMRDATPADGPLDSPQTRMLTGMLDAQLAQQMSSRGIGLADMLLRQLSPGSGPATPTGTAGNPLPLRGAAYGPADGMGVPPPLEHARNGTMRGLGDTPADFVARLADEAQRASASTGIPARYMLGQAALESGWGKREIQRADGSTSYNLFGIKADKHWQGATVEVNTTEYVNGVRHRVRARFRAYGSYQEAFADYANLLRNNPRYARVLAAGGDARAFAQGLQRAGYATDPRYAEKLLRVMRQLG